MGRFFTALIIFISCLAHGQVLKTLGIKTGITQSYFTWNYKESSTATYVGHDKSDKAMGLVFLLTGDFIDRKYWGVNLSAGWLTRNAKVNYDQGSSRKNELKYETGYLTIIPSFKGKLPIGKSLNIYGQIGVRADFMLSHSDNIESYTRFFYRIQKEEDLKKMNYGLSLSPGIEKTFKKLILRIEYSRLLNFNKIINEKGQRLDGYGDEGFFFKLNSITSMYTLNLAVKL